MVLQNNDKQEDDVNTRIFHSIADVFQKAQLSYAGHRKHVAVLKKILSKAAAQGYESAFNYWFDTLVTKILPLKKNDVVGDRIVKLVAAFIASRERELRKDNESENEKSLEAAKSSTSEDEEVFLTFMDQFIRHILRGIESKDRNVRYRVVQLLAMIMDNIGELDESLYNLLVWSLNKRIYDKEANVRMQVVFCLTKFQDDETQEGENSTQGATETLLSLVQNDPSAEVRRAAMLNLVNNNKTQPYILERARDANQVNRRLVYTRILRSMGKECFEQLDSGVIDQLIKWGLEDREFLVRKACSKLISHDWLNLLGGDLIEFLERLNVTKSSVASQAMECLFTTRPDIISKVNFPLEIWADLTVEISFLSRCFYIHCLESDLTEVIERNFPEASKLANYLDSYVKQRFIDENCSSISTFDQLNLEFIIEQLLITANRYDFSDEIGRRSMLTVVRNMLGLFDLSESLIDIGLQLLKSLSINERDFITMGIEIINDIRDDDIERQELEEAKLKVDQNSSDEDDDEIESFHRAVERTIRGNPLPPGDHLLKNLAAPKEARCDTIVACLTRSSHMLELVQKPLDQNILITSLIETLITPAVRNNDTKIRELGVRNLGLCCLLDVQLATENMYILGMCVSKGNESLKNIALKVIIDIFSVHGLNVVDGPNKVDSISLHKIFYKVLKNDDLPKCQVVAAEGLCKLFLADVFTDDDLFETLILSYFSPVNSSNEALIQAFAFCIPVYCFSHINHQKRLARIAADVLLRLCMLWEDLQTSEVSESNRGSMLRPNIIFQQLIHWTDPRKIINQSEGEAYKNPVQVSFLLDFLKILPKIEKKDIKKLLLTNINAIFVTAEQNYDKLKELSEHVDDLIENEHLDPVSHNSLMKFKDNLSNVLDDAYEKISNRTESEAAENKDDEYYKILQSTGDDSGNEIQILNRDTTREPVENINEIEGLSNECAKKRGRSESDDDNSTNSEGDKDPLPDTRSTVKSSDTLKNVSFLLPESIGNKSDINKDDEDAIMMDGEDNSSFSENQSSP